MKTNQETKIMKIGPSVKTATQIRNLEKALLNFESLDTIQE
jgi:hypothetical protein